MRERESHLSLSPCVCWGSQTENVSRHLQLTGGHGGRRKGGGTPGFGGAYLDWKEEGRQASKAGLGMELEKWFSIFLSIVLASSS